VTTKELCKLSPDELSARYLELHEKLVNQVKKKAAKEKSKKKKKKSKTARGKRDDGRIVNFSNVDKLGSLKCAVRSDSQIETKTVDSKTLIPKSILKMTEDYFQEYQQSIFIFPP
jgi:hypothetical protein